MTNWTWKFFDALVFNENGVVDALKEVNYLLRGTRGEGEDAKAHEIGGRAAFAFFDPANFKPFADLTEADLVAFLSSVVDVEKIKAQIDAWHDAAVNIKTLPFEKIET
jgi:hypothetical protein